MSELKNASLATDMSQPENTKMFVGGLSWETTLETFTDYFKTYGEITDSVIMKDGSGKPRGFGFVTFKKACSVGSVLGKKEHKIDGKHVDPKIAEKRGTPSSLNQSQSPPNLFPQPTVQTRKIFVGGIPPGTTEDELKKHFVSYGNVVKVEIKLDKESNRPRGFGFLTLDDDKSVEKICKDHFFRINGKQVECKLAQDPPSGQDLTSPNLMSTYPPGYSSYTDPAYYYAYAYCYGSQTFPYGQYFPYSSSYGYNYSTGEYYGLNQDGSQRNFNSYFAQSAYPSTGSQQHSGYQGYYPIQGDMGQTTNGGGGFSRGKNGSSNNSQSRASNSSGGYY